MDNMCEMRNRLNNGDYSLKLEIGENSYFKTYEDINTKSAEDVVRNYLRSNADDAEFSNLEIKHHRDRHTVSVCAKLSYDNDRHTDYSKRNKLM
ncbi:hypothetical protein GCM10008904_28600 [Paraclostridium ghonii]|uniref:Uncharacterized protein n=1 Tax=Paraclostridium ghonii TaxID=29358 RepID=A0ABU0N3B6_9FIRM|nr:hypothetical protein [Paeniclostridium ghonii]MCM0167215.1 hypothetical protein [Paeniclostridium ghonii]MDQ0557652.1 hypothetical protein [Paeniclostridium ghonii]